MNKNTVMMIAAAVVLALGSVMSVSANGMEDFNDYFNADGTYSYYFEQGITITMSEEWYQNTFVQAELASITFYHKDSYEKYKDIGIEDGGKLFTVGCSVNSDFKDLDEMTYIGFDEEEVLNYYATKPTDYQAYVSDPEVKAEYDSLWSTVDDVIGSIRILSAEPSGSENNEMGSIDAVDNIYGTASSDLHSSEGLPLIHLPQEGELLVKALSDQHMEHIEEDHPVKIEIRIDRGGDLSETTIKDKEMIRELVDAFSKIQIGKQTWEVVTDNYNRFVFTFSDGTEVIISLNLKNLELHSYHGYQYYELDEFDEFWNKMVELTSDK